MLSKITRLFDCIHYQKEYFPLQNSFNSKHNNSWQHISTKEIINTANQVSRALLKLGIQPNNKIALIVENSLPNWHFVDIGTLQIGAQNVPLYGTLSESDTEYIINHSDSMYCFVAGDAIFNKVKNIQAKTQLKNIIRLDVMEGPHGWETFLKLGEDDTLQAKVETLKNKVKPEDLATIIYTSGTTGTPKGVMLTHQNIVENIKVTGARLNIYGHKKRVVSYLPVSHVFERAATYYAQLMGFEIYFAESIDSLGETIKEVKPHFLPVVPRLVEKIYDKIIDKGTTLSFIKKRLFFWALDLSENYKAYNKNSLGYRLQLTLARKLIFSKWREAFGGEIEFLVSGSAPLQSRLIRVFTAAGIPIYEGYGMTEASPGISLNDLRNKGLKIGTVGKPLEGVKVKIAEDGEILVKGPNIMQGYYKNEELTQETIIDGYLHTGDIGKIDSDGFLTITDRKKLIFKTSGGKYIAPTVLENEMKKSRFIEQIMVVGENQKMPTALIQLNYDFIDDWVKFKGHTINDYHSSEILREKIQKEIHKLNQKFGKWEQIKDFEITTDRWTVEEGHLTPTLKMRRKQITEKYAQLIDKLYAK